MSPDLGALPDGPGTVRFRVWAPHRRRVTVRLLGPGPGREVALVPDDHGDFAGVVDGVTPGTRYRYRLDDALERPDPASRWQPEGVHGPSTVVDPAAFSWTDAGWRGVPLPELCFYELHVGTFTPAGTFDAVVAHLPELVDLGITAIELMPVAEFPGTRNWGYDGVHLYAPQSSYGGPDGFRRLVDAAHRLGLAVILDVVYNHLGPEGNYLADFGPYFSRRRRTPWGAAPDWDGPAAAAVRRHVVANACHWVREYRVDGLRLDAVHAMVDEGPVHILAELAAWAMAEAERLGRPVHLVAEMNRNDPRVVRPSARGGWGLGSQWSDDLHHALRVTLTGIRGGYYEDFPRGLDDLEVALREAFVLQGQHSRYRGEPIGCPVPDLPGEAFVVFAQNHDQVGNHAGGARLTGQVPPAALRVAAATVLLAPYLPLLFMGEEYGETAPFRFFTSYGDRRLGDAARAGRRRGFERFGWTPDEDDPQDPRLYEASRLDRRRRETSPHRDLLAWYRALLHLRRRHPALGRPDRARSRIQRAGDSLAIFRWHEPETTGEAVLAVSSYSAREAAVTLEVPIGCWRLTLDSEAPEFGGRPGSAMPPTLDGGGVTMTLRPYQTLIYARRYP